MAKRAEFGAVVMVYLREAADSFATLDGPVRRDEDDAVHQMRVAARRLRSALRTYRPAFDRARVDALRSELAWIGRVLGYARDAEVLRQRLRDLMTVADADLMIGPVAARADSEMAERCRRARRQLDEVLEGSRYFRLLDRLDSLVTNPPTIAKAREPAARELNRVVAAERKRVERLARRVEQAEDDASRDRRLHEVRKAAKRARYAAEVAVVELGAPAARQVRKMERIQEVLGEHHDSVAARGALLQAATAAHLAGENSFSFGVLHAVEAERGRAALPRLP